MSVFLHVGTRYLDIVGRFDWERADKAAVEA